MAIVRCIRLFSECYKIAGGTGLIACAKYLFGVLRLEETNLKSLDFAVGGSDA